ncbi:MAG: MHS family MFS transporter [Phycisphaerales bacterium]|nr:MHS family MFS transporter [Phycisphaerales bacterium]
MPNDTTTKGASRSPDSAEPVKPQSLATIITASSAGTLIEWYDFYIFGALAVTLSDVFFPKGTGATALLSVLATFAIGFVVRPFGAIVFGHLGDLIGRKYTVMVTLLLMGGATFLIGLLPGFATIGWAAPVLLVILRLCQGLALGGEYGGAATYVAEHCPDGRRGYWTSWIQTTATLGLVLSLIVILGCRKLLTPEQFAAWGWRIPFWLSLALVTFSYYIRKRMSESPLFARMKASGKNAKNPIRESLGNKSNLKLVLLALLGATAGQGVVWYTGQFYAMNFIKLMLGIEAVQAEYITGIALIAGTPFFIVMGTLSDRIGRKPVMLAGCLLALATYYPIYSAMVSAADLKDPSRFQLAGDGIQPLGTSTIDQVGADTVTKSKETRTYRDGTVNTVTTTQTRAADGTERIATTQSIRFASLTSPPALLLTLLIWIQVLYVTMVYGPIAAFLVELFPTRIRYTSMSLPYHIGNGVFGGMVPFIGQLMVQKTGNIYAGLSYPMAICLLTLVVGGVFIKESRGVRMLDEH